MFPKMKITRQIKALEKQITEIETKRSRSQSALVQAILESKDPNEDDVEFFNRYTSQIDEIRNQIRDLKIQLSTIK